MATVKKNKESTTVLPTGTFTFNINGVNISFKADGVTSNNITAAQLAILTGSGKFSATGSAGAYVISPVKGFTDYVQSAKDKANFNGVELLLTVDNTTSHTFTDGQTAALTLSGKYTIT